MAGQVIMQKKKDPHLLNFGFWFLISFSIVQ